MSKALKSMAMKVALVNAMAIGAMGGAMPYGLAERKPRATTEEDNKFVEKQGYKQPSYRNGYKKWLHRKHLKLRTRKGHKHGGARR